MMVVILFHKSEFRFFKYFDVTVLKYLTKDLKGILLEDNGYLGKEKAEALAARGLKLLTSSQKNIRNKSIQAKEEKQLFSRRGLIEK